MLGPEVGEAVGDQLNHLGALEHANFYCGHRQVLEYGFNLAFEDVETRRLDGLNALGVLGSQGGDGAGSIATQSRNGLDVGLNTRATARVGASNGEDNARMSQKRNPFLKKRG